MVASTLTGFNDVASTPSFINQSVVDVATTGTKLIKLGAPSKAKVTKGRSASVVVLFCILTAYCAASHSVFLYAVVTKWKRFAGSIPFSNWIGNF